MENQSSNPGARVGGFSSPAKINGKSILQPWRQGLGIPKSCRTWDSSDPGAMVGGLIFHWFLQKSMENQFYNPGSKVGGFPSPAKNNWKSILKPWRQGLRILKSCKNQWKVNPPTLALGSEDSQVLQKQMENQSYNPGARV